MQIAIYRVILWIIADLESLDDVLIQPAPSKICAAVCAGLGIQLIAGVLDHLVEQPMQGGDMRVHCRRAHPLQRRRQRHAGIFRHLVDSFDERDLLVLLHEAEHISARPADKALEDLFVLGDVHRGIVVIVKRTYRAIIPPALVQRDIVRDHIDDAGLRTDPADLLFA